MTRKASTSRDPIGHHERFAVGAGQELVGLGVADERLGRGVEGELAAEAIVQAVELRPCSP